MFDPELASPGSDEERLLHEIDPDRLPAHVALIMDGNGRWARRRHLPRAMGHRAGVRAVRETVEVAARLGIDRLTLYAFSHENWRRPPAEIETLMGLLREYVKKELDDLVRNDIRLFVIGCPDELPEAVRHDVETAVRATADSTGLEVAIALSYGGRQEIVDACRSILRSGIAPDELDVAEFERHLSTAGVTDPDLLIRTSGEMRVSNFLLWQIAYAEMWVTDTLWPDFRRKDLFTAILDYQKRERRYGGLTRRSSERAPAAVRG